MSLCKLQQEFFQAIMGEDQRFAYRLAKNYSIKPTESIRIYRESTLGSHSQALKEIYRVILELVGQDYFHWLTKQYIAQYPSKEYTLNMYGKFFADFLQTLDLHLINIPYLADMAQLEWSYHIAQIENYFSPLDVHMLNEITYEAALQWIFYLQPYGTLLESPYAILQLWEMHQSSYRGNFHVHKTNNVDRIWVCPQPLGAGMYTVSEDEWMLLSAIKQHKTLSELYELFATDGKAELIMTLLPKFLQQGWLINQTTSLSKKE